MVTLLSVDPDPDLEALLRLVLLIVHKHQHVQDAGCGRTPIKRHAQRARGPRRQLQALRREVNQPGLVGTKCERAVRLVRVGVLDLLVGDGADGQLNLERPVISKARRLHVQLGADAAGSPFDLHADLMTQHQSVPSLLTGR